MMLYRLCIFICMFSVLLSACGSNQTVVTDEDFERGIGRLEVQFMRNYPPNEVRQNSEEQIIFDVKNSGVHAIEQGFIRLITDATFVQTPQQVQSFVLEGKSSMNPRGGQKRLAFPLNIKNLPPSSAFTDQTISAQICYDYVTRFNDQVCVKVEDFSEITSSCTISDLRSSGQGSPIIVSDVRVIMHPFNDHSVNPEFRITIKNTRGGRVYRHDSEQCMEHINELSLSAVLGDDILDCDQDIVRLSNNEATVVCKGRAVQTSTVGFERSLSIQLSYMYSEIISKPIKIVR
ncbi:MAG: hypothetical protein ACMXYC_00415 [Candidatus Woesearchaeota archaeon]